MSNVQEDETAQLKGVCDVVYCPGDILLNIPSSFNKISKVARRNGKMIEGWTWKTWIPIVSNACGGVVVGLVTKHAGAVRKGFALIFGLVLSGVLQSYLSSSDDKIWHIPSLSGCWQLVTEKG